MFKLPGVILSTTTIQQLHNKSVICGENNVHTEKIEWSYIEQLNQVQEDIGFSLANKLKKRHILWQKHKMSVPLAVQTLSASVAHRLEFLWDEMALETFAGSNPTSDFIKKLMKSLTC